MYNNLFKAVIFDMDGLMIDTERLYIDTEKEIAREYNKLPSEDLLCKMMGRKPIESMKIFAKELDIKVSPEKLLEKRTKIMINKMKKDLNPMKGLAEILLYLYPRFKLAIATGATIEFVNIMIEKFYIKEYFDVIQTSEEIKNGKPDPEIYLKVVEKLNLAPNECIVLEDSSNGVKSAKNAGCYVIAIPNNYTKNQNFEDADYIVCDLIQARDWIATITEGIFDANF